MEMASLGAGSGIPFQIDVPADVVHVLLRLDPADSLADTVEDTAEETGIDPDELRGATARTVRRLLAHGMMRPMPH
jgi:hypothetical protein